MFYFWGNSRSSYLMKTIDLLFFRALNYVPPNWAAIVAGICVFITLSLSVYLLCEHLSAYKNPEEQKFLIGVILMVPCYSIESFVSLLYPPISVDCEILRDCYEAFAMYCFGRYLTACLGGEKSTIEFLEREGRLCPKTPLLGNSSVKGIVKHPFPMNYIFKPWKLGEWFYQLVKFGIAQYMIVKSLSALLALVLQAFGSYCDGEFKLQCGYIYMAVVLNFSQSWALYCLVQFYAATKDELEHIKPLAKFLTFKSIVFLTWWQGVGIALLITFGLFKSPVAESLQFKSSIQDFIICLEMCVASIVHIYVFPAKPYALMGDRFSGTVSVLGDYASVDNPLDPEEVRDSERPTKLRLPQQHIVDVRTGTGIGKSVCDVVLGGGEYIAKDLKFTVTQAVEPMEKGFTLINEKLQKISLSFKRREREMRQANDESCVNPFSPTGRVVRGIDDPLLSGSVSESGITKGKKQHGKRISGYNSSESGGESSDQSFGGYQIRGNRWATKD